MPHMVWDPVAARMLAAPPAGDAEADAMVARMMKHLQNRRARGGPA